MRLSEFATKSIKEDASGGGTSSGAVATSIGGAAGFGLSPFMRQPAKRKTKKSKK